MGTFNTIAATLICPRCDQTIRAEVEVREGNTSQMIYLELGDNYPWLVGKRPSHGNLDCDGYMECDLCGKSRIHDCARERRSRGKRGN